MFWVLILLALAIFFIVKAPQLAYMAAQAKKYFNDQMKKAGEEFSEKGDDKNG